MRTRLILILLSLSLSLSLSAPALASAQSKGALECTALHSAKSVLTERVETDELAWGEHLHIELRSCSPSRPIHAHYHFTIGVRDAEGTFLVTTHPLRIHDLHAQCDKGYVSAGPTCIHPVVVPEAPPAPAPPAPSPTPAPVETPKPKGPQTGSIGDSLTLGDGLSVTPTVQDPATPANEFLTPKAGSRLVAVHVALDNTGSSTVESDADGDTSVIGSNTQAYDTNFYEVVGCTNFSYGQFTLTRGATETGCVVYELPDGVTVQTIQFSLNTFTGIEAQWSA